jgi:hypothetical protein
MRQQIIAESCHHRHVGSIASAYHEDASDARRVVSGNLATIQAFYGHNAQAAETIDSLRTRYPGFSAKNLRRSELYRDAQNLDRVLMVLNKAGLPE